MLETGVATAPCLIGSDLEEKSSRSDRNNYVTLSRTDQKMHVNGTKPLRLPPSKLAPGSGPRLKFDN